MQLACGAHRRPDTKPLSDCRPPAEGPVRRCEPPAAAAKQGERALITLSAAQRGSRHRTTVRARHAGLPTR